MSLITRRIYEKAGATKDSATSTTSNFIQEGIKKTQNITDEQWKSGDLLTTRRTSLEEQTGGDWTYTTNQSSGDTDDSVFNRVSGADFSNLWASGFNAGAIGAELGNSFAQGGTDTVTDTQNQIDNTVQGTKDTVQETTKQVEETVNKTVNKIAPGLGNVGDAAGKAILAVFALVMVLGIGYILSALKPVIQAVFGGE